MAQTITRHSPTKVLSRLFCKADLDVFGENVVVRSYSHADPFQFDALRAEAAWTAQIKTLAHH